MNMVVLTFLLNTELYSSEVSCLKVGKQTDTMIKTIEQDIKSRKDIHQKFKDLEDFVRFNSRCKDLDKKYTYKIKYKFEDYTNYQDKEFNLDSASCKETFVDTKDMPLNRDQDNLGWCFAYSATDLFSFYEQVKFSSYDVAMQTHLKSDQFEKPLDFTDTGGFSGTTLQALIESNKGICKEEVINPNQSHWQEFSELIAKITKPKSNLNTIFCEERYSHFEFLRIISPDLLKIVSKIQPHKRTMAMFDIICKERTKLKNKYHSKMLFSESKDLKIQKEEKIKLISKVDSFLEKKEPVSAGYASEVLKNGINFLGKPDHLSTVIGRKFNNETGSCEYLIRNSWGDDLECQKTPSIRCENGNYWIPRTTFVKNLDEIGWLEKANN